MSTCQATGWTSWCWWYIMSQHGRRFQPQSAAVVTYHGETPAAADRQSHVHDVFWLQQQLLTASMAMPASVIGLVVQPL
jgi:hypothetical protein